jgi:hypothetical protein
MRYVRMLGLCLLAVFALGAIMAAGASAKLPEFGKCQSVGTGGKYTDAGCTVKAHPQQGAYEWEPASATNAFSGEEMALANGFTFETASGEKIECQGFRRDSYIPFVLNGAKTPLWELKGCISEEQECSTLSIGSDPEIISNALDWLEEGRNWTGRLGFVERPNVVGLSFKANNTEASEPEHFFTAIACEGSIGTVLIGGERKGSNAIIGTLGPINAMTNEYQLTYSESESKPGVASPLRFAHKKPVQLRAFVHNHWENIALSAEIEIETEASEIKATA